jgi:hypothetical protein
LATKEYLPALSNPSKRLLIHTMRLSLNLLAPFFLLKSFASAADYSFMVTWKTRDAVGTCTAAMADTVRSKVETAANSYLAASSLPQVVSWSRGERHVVGRQLRTRDRLDTTLDSATSSTGTKCSSACAWTSCSKGTTCYDTYKCITCRREERQLYPVERALDAAAIAALQSGLIGACMATLDGEKRKSTYSTSCKAVLTEKLCDAVVTEVV